MAALLNKFPPKEKLSFLLAVCSMLLSGGCAVFKTTTPPVPQSQWKMLTGQVLYRDAKRSFVGDVTIRTDSEGRDYSMQVTKAGANLLNLDVQENMGWARGPVSVLPFSGKIAAAPPHLQRWFAATSEAIHARLPGLKKLSGTRPEPASEVTIKFRLEP